jgi:hypothetical protein
MFHAGQFRPRWRESANRDFPPGLPALIDAAIAGNADRQVDARPELWKYPAFLFDPMESTGFSQAVHHRFTGTAHAFPMTNIHHVMSTALLAVSSGLPAQTLEQAEVRIPYQELRRLIDSAESAKAPESPGPALLSARFVLLIEDGKPVVDATFRATSFDNKHAFVPLVSGALALDRQDPADTRILARDGWLSLAIDKAGTVEQRLRLLPPPDDSGFIISLPPCPSAMLETAGLTEGRAYRITIGGREETLTTGKSLPLRHDGGGIHIRPLDDRESREALLPPEPSEWAWQHQALVVPEDGGLIYQIAGVASATGGAGVEALLPMPKDAREIAVNGEDLVSHGILRRADGATGLALRWKTRGIMDRHITVIYRMPLRPLDRKWLLQSPGGERTKTRFLLAGSPLLAYAADGLSGPLAPEGLPASFGALLKGRPCHHLEAGASAGINVTPIPVAATAEGVVTKADWNLRIEPDGAMLVTGQMSVEHKGLLPFTFDTPASMKLLTCEVNGKPSPPVDLGNGSLQVTLPPADKGTLVSCSFTGSGGALDPVEGTLKLSLPRTPLFIHSMQWSLDLPQVYQAETHGNLQRVTTTGKDNAASRITLRKNLCRDERPEIHLFYQRWDINR